jgi:lysophospholipid acyltransferase (LPLAT)-like uncharacterized protein
VTTAHDPATGGARAAEARKDWRVIVGVRIGLVFLRALSATWRVRYTNPEVLAALRERQRTAGRGFIFALWHGQMLPALYAHRGSGVGVLISSHRDGEIITQVVRAFGLTAIRGSTSRGGARALLEIVRQLRQGLEVAVTPDGPRGPAERFAPGTIAAAMQAEVPIIVVLAAARRAWRLRTWDGFMIPKPFTRVTIAYGGPEQVAATNARETDGDVARLEALMARTAALAAG